VSNIYQFALTQTSRVPASLVPLQQLLWISELLTDENTASRMEEKEKLWSSFQEMIMNWHTFIWSGTFNINDMVKKIKMGKLLSFFQFSFFKFLSKSKTSSLILYFFLFFLFSIFIHIM